MKTYSATLPSALQELFEKACGASNVCVYREGKPTTVEFTMYFNLGDVKYRADFEEKISVLHSMPGEASEWYMTGRAVEIVQQGFYLPADSAV